MTTGKTGSRIARRMDSIEASAIRRMFEMTANLDDPINLSIGQADFDPEPDVVEAAVRAIQDGENRYTVTQGLPQLNAAICDRIEREHGRRPESSIVTCGVSGGLLLSYFVTLNPGDEVLIPDPYFMLYRHQAVMAGAVPVTYSMYPDFAIDPERLESLITKKTRVLLLNSPQNPTGAIIPGDTLEAIADIARRHGLIVISDEIYDAFVYDAPFPSMHSHYEDTILLGGFSKTFGVAGWRLGFATGPQDLIEQMRTLQQFTFVCAPAPLQRAAVTAIQGDNPKAIDAYRRKRDLVVEKLQGRFELVAPAGSFYAFPRLPRGVDLDEFIDRAIQRNVLVVPGSAFSERATHFRLSFSIDDEALSTGLDQLNEIADELMPGR